MASVRQYLENLFGFNSKKDVQESTMNVPEISNSTATIFEQLKPITNFIAGIPKNAALAMATTPTERLALERIRAVMMNPHVKPASYLDYIKTLRLEGLFAGTHARTTYCLTGNFFTLGGMKIFGDDYQGLLITAMLKNSIYPVFLWSNAKQLNYTKEEMLASVMKGMKDPAAHSSFFLRNLLANFCLIPGFWVRDYTFQAWGETNDTLPKGLGLVTSLAFSATMNSFLKLLFTDPKKYPFEMRWDAAKKFPGLGALALREFASLSLIYANTSAKKAEPKPEDVTPRAVMKP